MGDRNNSNDHPHLSARGNRGDPLIVSLHHRVTDADMQDLVTDEPHLVQCSLVVVALSIVPLLLSPVEEQHPGDQPHQARRGEVVRVDANFTG